MFKINSHNFFRIWKTSLQKSIKFKRLNFLFSFDFLFGYQSSQTVFYKFVKIKKLESISNFGLIFFCFEKVFVSFYFFFVFRFCLFNTKEKTNKIKKNKAQKKFKSLKKKITD
jgi:hypothetical protein